MRHSKGVSIFICVRTPFWGDITPPLIYSVISKGKWFFYRQFPKGLMFLYFFELLRTSSRGKQRVTITGKF